MKWKSHWIYIIFSENFSIRWTSWKDGNEKNKSKKNVHFENGNRISNLTWEWKAGRIARRREEKKKIVIKFKWFHSRSEPEEECNLVEKIHFKDNEIAPSPPQQVPLKCPFFHPVSASHPRLDESRHSDSSGRVVANWNVNVGQSEFGRWSLKLPLRTQHSLLILRIATLESSRMSVIGLKLTSKHSTVPHFKKVYSRILNYLIYTGKSSSSSRRCLTFH